MDKLYKDNYTENSEIGKPIKTIDIKVRVLR